jgi:hypothetical protein
VRLGADVNGRDDGGERTLHCAATEGHVDAVRALVDWGQTWKITRLSGPMEYIVVLVTSYFRYLASAPKKHWLAGAVAPAL